VDAGLAEVVVRLRPPEHARADDEVGLVAGERLEHLGQLDRIPLAVGVERDDELRAVLACELVPDAQRDAVAAVALQPGDVHADGARDIARAVRAPVVDHERGDVEPAGGGRDRLEHARDRVGLVERGDHDDHRWEAEAGVRRAERAQPLVPNR
jgi:hypothetical protein